MQTALLVSGLNYHHQHGKQGSMLGVCCAAQQV
jgi:hypothetical protein